MTKRGPIAWRDDDERFKLRSEARIPLRNRAEVDTDLVREIREHVKGLPLPDNHRDHTARWERIKALCAEPTTDSGPSSADGAEVSSPRPPASPAGADLIQRLELVERYIGPSALAWARGHHWRCPTDCECRAVPTSGPPGAAAAKESGKTDAAAPEGAALHDATGDMPRWQCTRNGCGHWNRSIHRRCIRCGEMSLDGGPPESHACNPPPLRDPDCNCEQALELQQKLGRVEALVKLWSLQVADYPSTTEGQFGAAGVRCCIRELKEALRP